MALDLNDIATFVRVVRAGGFAAAGRRMGLPANTVSRRVQKLEEAIGARLLHRSTRKLSVTPAGRALFDRCASNVEEIEQAHHDAATSTLEPSGLVRIAAPTDFFGHFIGEWAISFMGKYPLVRMEFVLGDRVVDLVEEGIDVAFRPGPLEDSTLVARRIIDSGFALCASPLYLERRGIPDKVSDLALHDCILPPTRGERFAWRLEGPGGPAEVLVTGRLSVNTMQGAMYALRAGMGIALVPKILVAEDIHEGRLVHVLPEHDRGPSGFFAVYPSRRQLPAAVSSLVDFIIEKTEELARTVQSRTSGPRRRETPRRGKAKPVSA